MTTGRRRSRRIVGRGRGQGKICKVIPLTVPAVASGCMWQDNLNDYTH